MYTIKDLEQECIRRFGKDWENVKILKNAYGKLSENKGCFLPALADDEDDEIWGVNGVLHSKGEWAIPISSDIHTDIQSLKDKYPQYVITVSVEEKV